MRCRWAKKADRKGGFMSLKSIRFGLAVYGLATGRFTRYIYVGVVLKINSAVNAKGFSADGLSDPMHRCRKALCHAAVLGV